MGAYNRTTLAQLDARLLQRVGGGDMFWQPRERLRAINEALDVWQMLTGEYTSSVTATAVSTTDIISFATTDNVVIPLRAKVSTTAAIPPLVCGNIQDYDVGVYGWRSASSGTPEAWLPLGTERFIIYPKPTTNTPLTVLCVSDNYHLETGNTVDLGDEEIARILDYAQWYLSFKEGVPEGMENSSPLRELFLLAAGKRNARLRKSALYRRYMGAQGGEVSPSRESDNSGGFR